MRKLVSIICLIFFFSSVFGWDGNDNILYWQITDSESGDTGYTVDGGPDTLFMFLGYDHSDDELGVRIAAYDSNGNLVKYLNPVYPDTPEFPGGVDWEFNDQ